MTEITEEIIYHVNLNTAELTKLNNNDSVYIYVANHQIVLSK